MQALRAAGIPALQRRRKQAGFRDPDKTLDNFDSCFRCRKSNPSASGEHELPFRVM